MSSVLDRLGGELVGFWGQLSVEMALLAAVVLLVSRIVPIRSPAVRHLLWLAVLLKPIVALTVSSPWTVFGPLSSLVPVWSGFGAASFLDLEVGTGATTDLLPAAGASTWHLTLAGWAATVWVAGSLC